MGSDIYEPNTFSSPSLLVQQSQGMGEFFLWYIQHSFVDSISQDHLVQECAGWHSVNVEDFEIWVYLIGVCNQPTIC